MNPVEITSCLDSMRILVDTREQKTDRSERRYTSFGCPFDSQALMCGDYSVNFQKPDGRWLYNHSDSKISTFVMIERKASLEELSANLIQEKERFEREFQHGLDSGTRMYLLVEDANMEKMYNGRYKTKVHPNAYTASLWAIIARYKICGPIFCKPEMSGRVIHDILYRELKEKLERGDFDE